MDSLRKPEYLCRQSLFVTTSGCLSLKAYDLEDIHSQQSSDWRFLWRLEFCAINHQPLEHGSALHFFERTLKLNSEPVNHNSIKRPSPCWAQVETAQCHNQKGYKKECLPYFLRRDLFFKRKCIFWSGRTLFISETEYCSSYRILLGFSRLGVENSQNCVRRKCLVRLVSSCYSWGSCRPEKRCDQLRVAELGQERICDFQLKGNRNSLNIWGIWKHSAILFLCNNQIAKDFSLRFFNLDQV